MRLLREYPEAVEADLQRYYNIDYSDRWRFDSDGQRKLTLRRISVFIRYLPPDSAIAIATGGSGWLLSDYLLAHIFQATTGQPHPALPKQAKVEDPMKVKQIKSAKKRAEQRQRAIDSGEIT